MGIIISLTNPIKYYFTDKKIAELPEHITYKQAIIFELPEDINKKASEANCNANIKEIEVNEDELIMLPYLQEDLNIAFTNYKKWNVQISEELKEKFRANKDRSIETWGKMPGFMELMAESVSDEMKTEVLTRYIAEVKIEKIKTKTVNDLTLILSVNDQFNNLNIFKIRKTFSDPANIDKFEKLQEKKQQSLSLLREKSRRGLYSSGALLTLLIILFLVSFIISYRTKLKEDKKQDYLRNQILLRQELIDNGHFVAALELADRYLEYFPDDIEIKAFRERLLDVTNNDPKKAQVAYVEAKKLQLRLENRGHGNYLSNEEKEYLAILLPYHPELESSYIKMIGYEEEDRIRAEFDIKYRELVEIIRLRKWTMAEQEVRFLQKAYPENEQITDLQEEISQAIEHSEIKLKDIKAIIGEADIYEIHKELDELLTDHIDNEAALEMKNILNNSKVLEGIFLESDKGIILPVFCKSEVILGREDEGVKVDIAIDSKYISRPHLKMELIEGKLYLEDLNSSGGSYKAGEKIDRTEITNNQTVTLAKVIDLNICLQKVDNWVSCVIMECADKSWAIIDKEMKFSIKGNKLDLSQSDNILKLQDPLIIYRNGNSTDILQDGAMVNINGNEYRVKFI